MSKKSCCLYPVLAVLATILLLLATPTFLGLLFRDSGPVDDTDFALDTPLIADEDNGYFELLHLQEIEISDEVDNEVKAHLNGEKWDPAFVAQTLSDYSAALALFESAASKPNYQDPIFLDPPEGQVLVFSEIMTVNRFARLTALNAKALMEEGAQDKALKAGFLPVELGARMMRSNTTLLSFYIAKSVQETGLNTWNELIPQVTDASLLTPYIERLSAFELNDEEKMRPFKVEYQLMGTLFDRIENDPTLLHQFGNFYDEDEFMLQLIRWDGWSFYYHPNESKALFYKNMKAAAEWVQSSCERREMEYDAISPGEPAFYFQENALGIYIVDSLELNVNGKLFCEANEDLQVTQDVIEAQSELP